MFKRLIGFGVMMWTGCPELEAFTEPSGPDAATCAPSTPTSSPPGAGERVPWCHQGTIYDSPIIEWDAAELVAMMSLYGTDTWVTTDESIAHGTADYYCADVYSMGALQGAGESVISTHPAAAGYGQAQGGLGPLSLGPSYSLTEGLTFTCDMCGYYPIIELDDEPVDVEPAPELGQGMTWVHKEVHPVTGVVTVGCDNGTQCNPIHGDTACNLPLPLLCYADYGLPEPVSSPGTNAYFTWSGGVVATTPPVAPALDGLATLADADARCAAEFGPDFRTAEFHEGWGWNFLAYGNVGDEPRFWVNIDDQPDGTCWTQ